MKVLVIDDEKPTLSMFRLFLTAYGYEVHTALSGEEGITIFKALVPEIVFTDIRMPGMDGIEVLEKIRQICPLSQVIIITGHGDMEKAMEALDLGASDFINKPVERAALNCALARAEKRGSMPNDQPFSLDFDSRSGIVDIKGHMSGDCAPALDGLTGENGMTRDNLPKGLRFRFDDSFSIDRRGIFLLMDTVQTLNKNKIQVHLTGLSYNYLRFFEMAGLNKIAVMEEGKIEEAGI